MTATDQDTVVVGFDASRNSSWGLDWAISEAARSSRSLLIVHVWNWTSDVVGSISSEDGASPSRHMGHRLLSHAANEARKAGVPVRTSLTHGCPADMLCDASVGAAMLVVGAHGRGPVVRTFLGSVSRACLEKSTCPVVVVSRRPCPAPSPETNSSAETAKKNLGERWSELSGI